MSARADVVAANPPSFRVVRYAVPVGFIGLGRMGAPMAARLLAAGVELVLFDRDERRGGALVERGARRAASAAEAASGAEAVLLSLPGPPEVERVVLEGGVLAGMEPGSSLVCLSTVSPRLVRHLEAEARPRGIAVLDAPVTGAADGARAGTLTIMVGAERDALAACRPLLEPLATSIVHTGPVGTGSAAKLVTNMLWFVHVVALSDALALGVKAGIEAETLAELIPASAGASWVAEHDLPNVLAGDDDESFTLALCRKDLGLIDELARELDVPAALADAARARFEAAHERFGPHAGELSVARISEEAAGVSIRATTREEETWQQP